MYLRNTIFLWWVPKNPLPPSPLSSPLKFYYRAFGIIFCYLIFFYFPQDKNFSSIFKSLGTKALNSILFSNRFLTKFLCLFAQNVKVSFENRNELSSGKWCENLYF